MVVVSVDNFFADEIGCEVETRMAAMPLHWGFFTSLIHLISSHCHRHRLKY
jgi:hypothetical protein